MYCPRICASGMYMHEIHSKQLLSEKQAGPVLLRVNSP
jgi:hypothetical protein